MGKLEETMGAYYGTEEKVIAEKDKMGLVQALEILHRLRDLHSGNEYVYEAFQTVFEWIDNMVLLLKKIGGQTDHE